MHTAIVTDSTSDIPKDLAEQYDIQIVPNIMVIDGQEYEDGQGISREEFYQRLPNLNPPPSTATSSSGVYKNLYQHLLGMGYEEVVSIHTSGLLSGIINAANAAAQAFSGRVRVVDSEQVSTGLGFQVLEIADQLANGLPLDSILSCLPAYRQRLHLIAMLDTLDYVRRSGRVSWARAQIGNLLRIKPFIGVKNGEVLRFGEVRTRNKGIERLREILHNLGPLERLAILHTNAAPEAHDFLGSITVIPPIMPIVINVTTIIGVHTGPNALGFTAVTQEN